VSATANTITQSTSVAVVAASTPIATTAAVFSKVALIKITALAAIGTGGIGYGVHHIQKQSSKENTLAVITEEKSNKQPAYTSEHDQKIDDIQDHQIETLVETQPKKNSAQELKIIPEMKTEIQKVSLQKTKIIQEKTAQNVIIPKNNATADETKESIQSNELIAELKLFEEAQHKIKVHNYHSAIPLLEDYIRRYPHGSLFIESHLLLVDAYGTTQQFDKMQAHTKRLKDDPRFATYHQKIDDLLKKNLSTE
jgi:TolA-binding protein